MIQINDTIIHDVILRDIKLSELLNQNYEGELKCIVDDIKEVVDEINDSDTYNNDIIRAYKKNLFVRIDIRYEKILVLYDHSAITINGICDFKLCDLIVKYFIDKLYNLNFNVSRL